MITVYFEDPFWVGLFEREDGDEYQVCKFPFGGEPKDYEVYDFLMRNWSRLVFSPKLSGEALQPPHRRNPRRERRKAKKDISGSAPVGTKAQEALKLQREENKTVRQAQTRQERELEQERKFQLRQEKRKAKRKGH